MTVTLEPTTNAGTSVTTKFLALDLTRACQAKCDHCYNEAGPGGTAGDMKRADWISVLDQAAVMGVTQVQFIGGEPTMHPDLADLVNHALDRGLAVEVFSNLIHIRRMLWPVLRQRGVTLATSYYSDSAAEHESITHHTGSYRRTKANIKKALGFRIPLRAGIVHVKDGQRVEQAMAELRALGVKKVRTDRLRGLGRAVGEHVADEVGELCGHCTHGRAAVMPNGDVAGCVMSGGMMTAGNVHAMPLASIVGNEVWQKFAATLPEPDAWRHEGCTPDEDSCRPSPGADPLEGALVTDACVPDSCTPKEDSCQPSPGTDPWADLTTPAGRSVDEYGPNDRVAVTGCNPDQDSSDCAPAETEACGPAY